MDPTHLTQGTTSPFIPGTRSKVIHIRKYSLESYKQERSML